MNLVIALQKAEMFRRLAWLGARRFPRSSTTKHDDEDLKMPFSILVVEDDDDVRELVSTALRDRGYSVLSVPNAEVALQILMERVRFDLLFTDIIMPGGMDGFQLADHAKALQPDLKVLYATGYSYGPMRSADQLHGKIIQKPIRPNQLASEVHTALANPS